MKLQSLNKDYKLFANIVIAGAILTSFLILLFSYNEFKKNSELYVVTTANQIDQKINESLYYIENIANLIGNQVLDKENFKKSKNVAEILLRTRPKIDQNSHDIFTWTLFDFINDKNEVIASSSQGALSQPIPISIEQRSWISDSRNTPWKLLPSKSDTGLISKEKIIPFGFGITKPNGEFVGIVSVGININKLQKKLISISDKKYVYFIVVDNRNSEVVSSSNLSEEQVRNITKILHNNTQQGFITVDSQEFYYHINHEYNFKVITGVESKLFNAELRSRLFPKILNTIYSALFFLILLYFFRAKLLKPVTKLAAAADRISKGHYDTAIPKSEIFEVELLSKSIERVKEFLKNQEVFNQNLRSKKESAEQDNFHKTEFLASTAHELKNMLAGIVGISSLIKINLNEINVSDREERTKKNESVSWLNDLIKLGEECASFVNDILDVNQAQSGDFKIEEQNRVDLKDIISRSVKLMKIRAIKEKKTVLTSIDHEQNKKFIANNLDPRRLKQIVVNIISNSIKYSSENTKIKVRLYHLSLKESNRICNIIEEKIKENHNINESRREHLLSLTYNKRKFEETRICIEVEDQGHGMTEEEIKIALTKYGTINHDSDKKIDSTGLGFPIIKYLVEAQGGMLEIKSKKDEGTTVRVIF